MTSDTRDEPTFYWSVLVPYLVHPTKVTIIEALRWIGEPLSPSDISKMSGQSRLLSVSNVAYHMRKLEGQGVVRVKRRRKTRGSEEKFYDFVL